VVGEQTKKLGLPLARSTRKGRLARRVRKGMQDESKHRMTLQGFNPNPGMADPISDARGEPPGRPLEKVDLVRGRRLQAWTPFWPLCIASLLAILLALLEGYFRITVTLFYHLRQTGNEKALPAMRDFLDHFFWATTTPLILTNLIWILVLGWWRYRSNRPPRHHHSPDDDGPEFEC
jgi:hypothetical protein